MNARPAALTTTAFLFAATAVYALPTDEFIYEAPLNNSSLSGNMLTGETEFLTPVGILDNLPPSPVYETIEPAAGPSQAETSPTTP